MAQAPPASRIHAEIGDVSDGSQVAVGHNILQIQQLHGDLVYVRKGKPTPPRHRSQPVSLRPRAFPGLLDRKTETSASLAAIDARQSVECSGDSGAGKTSLLRYVAHQPVLERFSAGVLYFKVGKQSASDLLQSMFDAFYESDFPVKPTETEIRAHLANLNALVLLDDVDVDPDQIEYLMNVAASCTFVLASPKRSLAGETQAVALGGLPTRDAVTLFERELGRTLSDDERKAAERLCESLGCLPQRVLRAASQAREKKNLVAAAAPAIGTLTPDPVFAKAEIESRSEDERKVLAALAVFAGAPVRAQHVAAISEIKDTDRLLGELESRGLVDSHAGKYSISSDLADALQGGLDPLRVKALMHLENWTAENYGTQKVIADSAGPALLIMNWGLKSGFYPEVRRLGHAVESSLSLSGKWNMWSNALEVILSAARTEGDKSEEAWALHQLGTRALCLENPRDAKALLSSALSMRESLGDKAGAAATRHNLQLIAGPPLTDDDKPGQDDRIERLSRGGSTGVSTGMKRALLTGGAIAVALVALFVFWPDRPDSDDKIPVDTAVATPESTATAVSIPTVAEIKVTPVAIRAGETALLCFKTENAAAVQIDQILARTSASDTTQCVAVTPTVSTTYTLTAFNSEGDTTVTADIKVVPLKHATIQLFTANDSLVKPGTRIQLCYETTDAQSGRLEPLLEQLKSQSGCIADSPQTSTRYVLTVTGEDKQSEARDLTVEMIAGVPPTPESPASPWRGIESFTPDTQTIRRGTRTQLCYRTSSDEMTVELSPPARQVRPSTDGTCVVVLPRGTTQYTLTVTAPSGQRDSKSVTVTVVRAPVPPPVILRD